MRRTKMRHVYDNNDWNRRQSTPTEEAKETTNTSQICFQENFQHCNTMRRTKMRHVYDNNDWNRHQIETGRLGM